MWLLPSSPHALLKSFPTHSKLPGWYTRREVELLSVILRRLSDPGQRIVHLPWTYFMRHGARVHGKFKTFVFVQMPTKKEDLQDVEEALGQVKDCCFFTWDVEIEFHESIWLERLVKTVLHDVLVNVLERPGAPMQWFQVPGFDVDRFARVTGDPVVMLRMLHNAAEYYLEGDRGDFSPGLYRAIGAELAQRTNSLPEEQQSALISWLFQCHTPEEESLAHQALNQQGFGIGRGEHFISGALCRNFKHPFSLSTFRTHTRDNVWSPQVLAVFRERLVPQKEEPASLLIASNASLMYTTYGGEMLEAVYAWFLDLKQSLKPFTDAIKLMSSLSKDLSISVKPLLGQFPGVLHQLDVLQRGVFPEELAASALEAILRLLAIRSSNELQEQLQYIDILQNCFKRVGQGSGTCWLQVEVLLIALEAIMIWGSPVLHKNQAEQWLGFIDAVSIDANNELMIRVRQTKGTYYSWLGRVEDAYVLHKRTLDMSRELLGEEHPSTLTSMTNLTLTMMNQGDFAGARELGEQVFEIMRRVLGEEHPSTLTSMGNQSVIVWNQGELGWASELGEQVLEIRRRVLGEEHPSTLISMNNLATRMADQEDFAEARAIQEQVLEIMRRVLGEEHPSTLTSMGNLATIMVDQGDLEGAREIEEQVLEIRRRVLGEGHPFTLISMNNLLNTLIGVGDKSAAQVLLQLVRPHVQGSAEDLPSAGHRGLQRGLPSLERRIDAME